MNIRRLILGLSILLLATSACGLARPAAPVPSAVDIVARLDELGGQPCAENPDFTCVTVTVPLDHFDASNDETLDLMFAVAPASGERYGMYVQAYKDGPGHEGISTSTLQGFSDAILEHYDIVHFDQRGVGHSHPLSCPTAYASDYAAFLTEVNQAGLEGYDTPAEQQRAIEAARRSVEACIAELGPDAEKLAYFGTAQSAEDLETFRQLIGDEQFVLYGFSYGTAIAQTYAAAHPERLQGLVLDGAWDLTLSGEEAAFARDRAREEVLLAVFDACDADEACADEFDAGALAAYDELAAAVSSEPIAFEFRLPSGETVAHTFAFNQLELITAYQLHTISGRMLFLRALAAASNGDIVPMARLFYLQSGLDPTSAEPLENPIATDTLNRIVICTDKTFFSGTPEERVAQVIEAGQASNGTVPRLDGGIYDGLYCAFWPSSPAEPVETEPLRAEGVPTFVLNSTLDPSSPFEEGRTVFENLADGYHLYVNGGRHGTYGWEFECPDAYISNFLIAGVLPEERTIACEDWGEAVIVPYAARIAQQASDYADPLEILRAIDREIQFQPEFFYSYMPVETTVACPVGGSFTFGPGATGEELAFADCAFTRGFAITGNGSYDYPQGQFTLDVQVSGDNSGTLLYTRDLNDGSTALRGEYGGETIDLQGP